MQGELGSIVALPVAVVVDHQRAPGPVVEEPVRVEPRHRLVGQAAQQVLSKHAAGGTRVDEALKIVQQRRIRDIGRGGTEFV